MTEVSLVIPVKDLDRAKSRLKVPLQTRRSIAEQLMQHTLRTVNASEAVSDVVVVASDPGIRNFARTLGIDCVEDMHNELNGAIQSGLRAAAALWPGRMLGVLVSDLPCLTPAALDRVVMESIASARPRTVVDRAGTGTTFLSIPAGCDVPMRFGRGSAQRFAAEGCVPIDDAPFEMRADLDTVTDMEDIALRGQRRA